MRNSEVLVGDPPSDAAGPVDATSAAAAAAGLAGKLGLGVDDVVVLHEGSNVSVLLRPAMVVAKVGRRRGRIRRTAAWFAREVAVAAYLSRTGTRAVAPARAVAPGPHWYRGHLIAFWEPVTVAGPAPAPETLGASLRDCHRVLTGYRPTAAQFDPCAECFQVLTVTPRSHFLAGERAFLESQAPRVFGPLQNWDGPTQPLHGDPTPENVVSTSEGDVWLDFEDTHVGSTWWDVACLLAPSEVAGDAAFRDRAAAGYGVSLADPAARTFLAARIMHSAIWSAYVNSPGPSPRRLARLAWLERAGAR